MYMRIIKISQMVLLLLTFCLLLLPLWESVIVLCFVVRYFLSILVLQSSWCGRESWSLCLICLLGVSLWLSGSSSWCDGVVCSLWLWYFLIILTYYFWPWYIYLPNKIKLSQRVWKLWYAQAFIYKWTDWRHADFYNQRSSPGQGINSKPIIKAK